MTSAVLATVPPMRPVKLLANCSASTGPNGSGWPTVPCRAIDPENCGDERDEEGDDDPGPLRPSDSVSREVDTGELGDDQVEAEERGRGHDDAAGRDPAQLGELRDLDPCRGRAPPRAGSSAASCGRGWPVGPAVTARRTPASAGARPDRRARASATRGGEGPVVADQHRGGHEQVDPVAQAPLGRCAGGALREVDERDRARRSATTTLAGTELPWAHAGRRAGGSRFAHASSSVASLSCVGRRAPRAGARPGRAGRAARCPRARRWRRSPPRSPARPPWPPSGACRRGARAGPSA